MPEFSNFKITEPLVLQKPFREHLKFFLKDFAAYFGINHRGWHDMRRYHYTPGQEQPHLQVARLSQQEIDFVIQRSDEYLEEYIRALDQYNDDVLAQTTQGLALPLLEEIMSKNPVHKRIIDIGACYTRVFRKISSKYPDYIWDMVDFPTTLATANEPVATSSMEFHSDYPLDYLEKTDHVYDIANINRTLAWMGVDQIGEYLSILRERARYVVFAEPCKLLFEPGSLNIDAIPAHRPRCYNQNYLVHNYRAVFERFGFKLIHYDADSSTQPNTTPLHFIIRGVAVPV